MEKNIKYTIFGSSLLVSRNCYTQELKINPNYMITRNEQIRAWRRRNPEAWNAIVKRCKRKGRALKLQWVKNEYVRWRKWVAAHPERRREIAHDSYERAQAHRIRDT